VETTSTPTEYEKMEESILMKQILGSAGSGKGFVLANKVVEKLAEGRKVTVVAFEEENTLKKINFFLDSHSQPIEDNLNVVDGSQLSKGQLAKYLIESAEYFDVVFLDVPIILNRNIDRPYYASMTSYLNMMRSIADFTEIELWMTLQTNRQTMLARGACAIVVDEEETDKHEVIPLKTVQEWVGQYSKSVYC